jgi:hypothetical protein
MLPLLQIFDRSRCAPILDHYFHPSDSGIVQGHIYLPRDLRLILQQYREQRSFISTIQR